MDRRNGALCLESLAFYAVTVRFLPYPHQRLFLEAQRSPAEVIQKLAEAVEPRQWLRWPLRRSPRKPFTGRIRGDRFAVTFLPEYDELTSPVILGEVAPGPAGSRIRLVLRPRLSTLVGTAVFWCVGGALVAIRWGDWGMVFGMLALFVGFPYAACLFNFRRGSRVAREQLVKLLGCRDEPAARRMTRE